MPPQNYLVDLPDREGQAIRRLLKSPFLPVGFVSSLGLDSGFAWYILEMRMDRLSEFTGDIDLLAGQLRWRDPKAFDSLLAEEAKKAPDAHPSWHSFTAALRLAADGGIRWPPPTNYLVGIEAKCAYIAPEAERISNQAIKSKKSSPQKIRRLQGQVERLVMMGFDKVALLDMIATPPALGRNINAWFEALYTALQAWDVMQPILKKRLPEESLAGHWTWPIGSIVGGDESQRGAGAPVELRSARDNLYLQKDAAVQKRRQRMNEKVEDLMNGLPPPRSFPVIFVDCRLCCGIHSLDEPCP